MTYLDRANLVYNIVTQYVQHCYIDNIMLQRIILLLKESIVNCVHYIEDIPGTSSQESDLRESLIETMKSLDDVNNVSIKNHIKTVGNFISEIECITFKASDILPIFLSTKDANKVLEMLGADTLIDSTQAKSLAARYKAFIM